MFVIVISMYGCLVCMVVSILVKWNGCNCVWFMVFFDLGSQWGVVDGVYGFEDFFVGGWCIQWWVCVVIVNCSYCIVNGEEY